MASGRPPGRPRRDKRPTPKVLTREERERLGNYPPPEDVIDAPLAQDPDHWIVPASDDRGQHAKVMANIPPGLMRQIEVTIASGKFPYETASDFVRHAIVVLCEYLTRIDPAAPKHFLAGVKSINRIVLDDQFRMAAEEARQKAVRQINLHLEAGETSDAIRIIGGIRRELRQTDDSIQKREFERWFDATYGHLLRVQPARKNAISEATEAAVEPQAVATPARKLLPSYKAADEEPEHADDLPDLPWNVSM